MRIDPEARSVQGLSMFLSFVALNVIYLVVCLPVVTIGAATSALAEVTLRYSDDERGNPVRDFFPAFGRNAVRGSIAEAVFLLPSVAFAFAAVFWFRQDGFASGIAAAASIAAAVYLLTAFLVAAALIARFTSPVRQMLRNAALLPLAEPTRALGVTLIPVVLVCLSAIFPPFLIVVATIGVSFGAYLAAFLFRGMFARHGDGPAVDPRPEDARHEDF